MAPSGIHVRLRRLEGPGGRFLFLALDHGLPAGPLPGIEDPVALLKGLRRSPLTAVIANPGLVPRISRELAPQSGLIVHLSAGTVLGPRPTSKVLAALPERAVALGADAVSVQVHFGDVAEERMLADAGRVVDEAAALGLPVLGMAYAGGPTGSLVPHGVPHAARAVAELGVRIVQIPIPQDLAQVREAVRGTPVPVVLAGGAPARTPEEWLESLRAGVAAGAAGVAAGRNVFQHPDPSGIVARIAEILFEGKAVPAVPEA